MYMEELVEVAIGLVFVWLIISMATMQMQELYAGWTRKRSSDLSKAIGNIINDPTTFGSIYDHPLIKSLKEPANGWLDNLRRGIGQSISIDEQSNGWWDNLKRFIRQRIGEVPLFKNPSYIPASTFASVVFDVVANAGTTASPIRTQFSALRNAVGELEAGNLETANVLLGHIDNLVQTLAGSQIESVKNQVRTELNERLTQLRNISVDGQHPLAAFTTGLLTTFSTDNQDFASLLNGAGTYIDQVRKGAIVSGSTALGNTLASLLAGVEEYATDADKAFAVGRKNVEAWFDGSMDRLSGWYKRWAQTVAFFIGLSLALALNVDSIDLAKHLWREPALRQALAASATTWAAENPDLPKSADGAQGDIVKNLEAQLVTLNLPVGWRYESKSVIMDKTTGEPKVDPISKKLVCPHPTTYSTYKEGTGRLYLFGQSCTLYSNLPATLGQRLIKALGIVLTALAAMQGSPIWFDVLKKLVNVRSTGINPAEKPVVSTSDKER